MSLKTHFELLFSVQTLSKTWIKKQWNFRAMCFAQLSSELHARGEVPHPMQISVDEVVRSLEHFLNWRQNSSSIINVGNRPKQSAVQVFALSATIPSRLRNTSSRQSDRAYSVASFWQGGLPGVRWLAGPRQGIAHNWLQPKIFKTWEICHKIRSQ